MKLDPSTSIPGKTVVAKWKFSVGSSFPYMSWSEDLDDVFIMDSWKKSNLTITSYLCNDDFHMFVKISGWRKFDNETEFLLSRVGGGRQWWSAERYDSRSWCAADVLDLHHTPQGWQFSLRLIATDRTEISHSTTLHSQKQGICWDKLRIAISKDKSGVSRRVI